MKYIIKPKSFQFLLDEVNSYNVFIVKIQLKTMPRYNLGSIGTPLPDSLGYISRGEYNSPKDAARYVFRLVSDATSAIIVDESGNVKVFKRDEI